MYSLNRLKKGIRSTILYVIDTTADLLSTLGTLSSVFSGMSFAGSHYLDFGARITYYGNGGIEANSTTISVLNDWSQTYTRTNDHIEEKYIGNTAVSLNDFLTRDYVRLISMIALSNGMVLKIFGNMLHLWVQGKKDHIVLGDTLYQPPSWQEYGTQALRGMVSAPATAAISASVTSFVLHFHFRPINWEYGYPSNGTMMQNKEGMNKPMSTLSKEESRTYPIQFFQIPGLECKPDLKSAISENIVPTALPEKTKFECNPSLEFLNLTFIANIRMGVAYGVTISKENDPANSINSQQIATMVAGAIGGTCLYSMSRFFKSKGEQQRAARLQHLISQGEILPSASTGDEDPTETDLTEIDVTDSSTRHMV
ncbi:hypothetical protein [Legionella impletisoli]|uniref:Uncharacterized protein n=1 Tax=Legionella impletisoli TaxID=343510 RepID=A0A917JX25_9GAMM|nr:hypothetical protein [Legionella impletisoli]GGI88252.1 hypothetical protein GCM10007966_16240 [Legionella impletisoli]